MQILEAEIKSIIKQKVKNTTKSEEEKKDGIIKNLLMEFQEESREIVSVEKLNELQQILKELLN